MEKVLRNAEEVIKFIGWCIWEHEPSTTGRYRVIKTQEVAYRPGTLKKDGELRKGARATNYIIGFSVSEVFAEYICTQHNLAICARDGAEEIKRYLQAEIDWKVRDLTRIVNSLGNIQVNANPNEQ